MPDETPVVPTRPPRRAIMVRLSAKELEEFAGACRQAQVSQQRALAGLCKMFVEATARAAAEKATAATPAAE